MMLFSLPAFRNGKHDQLSLTLESLSRTEMASSLLDSTAAFEERARAFGVEAWVVTKFKEKYLNTFGRFAFAVAFNPQSQNDKPFVDYVENLAESALGQDQLAALRRLFFESHTLELADVRIRVECSKSVLKCCSLGSHLLCNHVVD